MDPVGPADGRDRRRWMVIAAVVVLLALLLVVLLLAQDDGDDDSTVAASSTSTSTTSLSTTTSTTEAPSSTTTSGAPKTTVPAAQCTPAGDGQKPALPAQAFYTAWRVGDEACAHKLGTDQAVATLFKLQPNGPEWEFQGCTEVAEPKVHGDCAFTYEGGSTHFNLSFADGTWSIYEVYSVAD